MKASTRKRGFTLIELLAVISVIAILAAMLLPALNRAKLTTDSVVCKNNLHQMTLAMAMYTQQTHTYPYFFHWPYELQPFLGSPWPDQNVQVDSNGNTLSYLGARSGVWACPAYNRVRGDFTGLFGEEWVSSRGAYSYNIEGIGKLPGVGYFFDDPSAPPLGLGGSGVMGVLYSTPESQIVSPSDMFALSDAPIDDQVYQGTTPFKYPGGFLYLDEALLNEATQYELLFAIPRGDQAVKANQQRHGGKWSMGFCDGHVESQRTSDLFGLTNADVAMRWNNDHKPHNQGWLPYPTP